MSILIVGVAAGLISGVFGVGGGILIVPGLMFFAKMEQRRSHGTSLAAVLPISLSSLVTYWAHGHVDWAVVVWPTIGAVAGAFIGTKLLKTARHDVLSYGFAFILVVTAIRLYWSTAASGRDELTLAAALLLIVIGLAVGTLAGLLGIGGGVIMVPAMVLLLGEANVMAKGTALAVTVPTAVVGTWRNRRSANVDVKAALIIGVAGILSAIAGGTIAAHMSESLSNGLFASLLLVVAAQMVYRERRDRSSKAPTQ